jgi:hypothetical protein
VRISSLRTPRGRRREAVRRSYASSVEWGGPDRCDDLRGPSVFSVRSGLALRDARDGAAPRLGDSARSSASACSRDSGAGSAIAARRTDGIAGIRGAPVSATHAIARGAEARSRWLPFYADSVHGRLPPAGASSLSWIRPGNTVRDPETRYRPHRHGPRRPAPQSDDRTRCCMNYVGCRMSATPMTRGTT